jgi:hypothetical protein
LGERYLLADEPFRLGARLRVAQRLVVVVDMLVVIVVVL